MSLSRSPSEERLEHTRASQLLRFSKAWHDDPTHPFAGIAEKVSRAEENIRCLNSEMKQFFNESEYPSIPEYDRHTLLEAIQYHKNRIVPPRFSVLTCEVIHHLRSCFDHIVWHFSTGPKQNDTPVDFPILLKEPTEKGSLARFDGKIHRITNADVRDLIKGLQPYASSDPLDHPMWVIHDFDIVDKHKELLLCVSAGTRLLPIAMKPILERYERAHPELDPAKIAMHFRHDGVLQPCIAFRNFGQRKTVPVIPVLLDLLQYAVDAIGRFADLQHGAGPLAPSRDH
jgi:hypothetical protein